MGTPEAQRRTRLSSRSWPRARARFLGRSLGCPPGTGPRYGKHVHRRQARFRTWSTNKLGKSKRLRLRVQTDRLSSSLLFTHRPGEGTVRQAFPSPIRPEDLPAARRGERPAASQFTPYTKGVITGGKWVPCGGYRRCDTSSSGTHDRKATRPAKRVQSVRLRAAGRKP